MKCSPAKYALAALPLLLAPMALAGGGPIHPLEGLDPVADGFSTNNPSAWFRGYEFTVAADNITVVELGMRTPVAGDEFILQLWNNNTQALVAQTAFVVSLTNEWQYFDIPDVQLDNGGRYTVGIFAPNGGTYFFGNNLPGDWYPSGDINYQTMRYHNNNTSGFPTSTLDGYQYGVPDIGYIVPAPGAMVLLGVAGFAARRRRRAS